jgi:hypothetical protein
MKYLVSHSFYDLVSALIGTALEDENDVELDIAMALIDELEIDTPETREYYGK